MSTANTQTQKVMVRVFVLAVASIVTCLQPAAAQTNRPQSGDNGRVQRDPTIPSPEIQRRARTSPTITSAPPPTQTVRSFAPRLGGDQIELQSLVQSSADRCTATLRAGGDTVTVSFVRGTMKREVQLPATQFADFASTVQRLSLELRQLRAQASLAIENLESSEGSNGDGEDPAQALRQQQEEAIAQAAADAEAQMLEVEREFLRQAMQPQRIDLESSFTIGGNLYRVIDFTRDTLLLEQVPLGKYVIVR